MTSTDWKLGLFVLLALAGAFATLVFLGATRRDETVGFVTYFDETVQGLEVGAPVKLRGVPIGDVVGLGFAPDRRRVAVHMAVSLDRLHALGLPPGRAPTPPPELRAQLATAGITGFKYVSLDLPRAPPPPPALEFAPPEHYVPARPSVLADLEESLHATLARAPEVADRLALALERVTAELDRADVPALTAQATRTLRTAEEALVDARGAVASVNSAARSSDLAVRRLDALTRETGPWVAHSRATLDEVGEAARALRRLLDALERDPDMLLHGRAK